MRLTCFFILFFFLIAACSPRGTSRYPQNRIDPQIASDSNRSIDLSRLPAIGDFGENVLSQLGDPDLIILDSGERETWVYNKLLLKDGNPNNSGQLKIQFNQEGSVIKTSY
ncbi:MAG TPA: hypothetical protein PKD37_04610 [Oligoflexia bacterium]|nr:hypothetical protein [Oligoflexia bacterium]HMP27246.1 hypothetical protein [Oligoflexia bacterium]